VAASVATNSDCGRVASHFSEADTTTLPISCEKGDAGTLIQGNDIVTKDLDLVRDLLLRAQNGQFSSSDPNIVYHIGLLMQAGLVRAVVTPRKWKNKFTLAILKRLTPAGCDFLRAAKNEMIWTRTKRNFIRPGLFFSLSLIADYLRPKEERVIIPMPDHEEHGIRSFVKQA
jgi:hypothetical protein